MDNTSLEYDFSGLEPPRGRILEIKSRSVGLQSPPQEDEKLNGTGVWATTGRSNDTRLALNMGTLGNSRSKVIKGRSCNNDTQSARNRSCLL